MPHSTFITDLKKKKTRLSERNPPSYTHTYTHTYTHSYTHTYTHRQREHCLTRNVLLCSTLHAVCCTSIFYYYVYYNMHIIHYTAKSLCTPVQHMSKFDL